MNKEHVDAGISIDIKSLVAIGGQTRVSHAQLLKNAKAILSGAHISTFRGRGMDFAESREYLPGDDRRHIDWRVTARTGKAHTKLYTEEKERPVFLLVDLSPSMFFGTQGGFKSVTAARLSAYLAWCTVGAGDRVGGVIGVDEHFVDLRPTSGRRGALKMINALSSATEYDPDLTYGGNHMLNGLLEQAGRLVHPGSQIFVISDFYLIDELTRRFVSRLVKHNDLMFCHIVDDLEVAPPEPGSYRFTDGQNSRSVGLRNQTGRKQYQHMFNHRVKTLSELSRSFSAPVVTMSAQDSFSTVFSENAPSRLNKSGK